MIYRIRRANWRDLAHGDDDVVEADPGSGLSPAGPELEGEEDE